MRINKHDTQGTKPLLGKGELGYDDYTAGGDTGRVYVGTGAENIALAKRLESNMMTKAQFNALAEERKANRAGSGFDEFGKHYSAATETPINNGLIASSFYKNGFTIGRRLLDGLGISKTKDPYFCISGVVSRLVGTNITDTSVRSAEILLPTAPNIYPYDTVLTAEQIASGVIKHADASNSGLIVNGKFDVDTSGWLSYESTLSVDTGRIKVTSNNASNFVGAYQACTTIVGKKYIVEVDIDNESFAYVYARATESTYIGTNLGSTSTIYSLTPSRLTFEFIATTTTTIIALRGASTASNQSAYFDNIAVYPADAISRSDLSMAESWHEDNSEKGIVYPLGNVQYLGANTDGLTGIANGAFTGFETYSLFGNWQTSSALIGKGYVWSTLTEAQKKAFIANPENNCYLDGDKTVQVRYRIRVVQGLGDSWGNIDANTSLTGLNAALKYGSYYLLAKGKQVFEDTFKSSLTAGNDFFYSGNAQYGYKSANGIFDAVESTGAIASSSLAYEGKCYALPIALVHRRNQGMYHPVYNPNGSKKASDGNFWYNTAVSFTSISDCFDPAKLLTASGYIGTVSGRPDGLFYDQVHEGDILDLRNSSKKVEDYNRLIGREFNKLVGGSNRGKEGEVQIFSNFNRVLSFGAFDGVVNTRKYLIYNSDLPILPIALVDNIQMSYPIVMVIKSGPDSGKILASRVYHKVSSTYFGFGNISTTQEYLVRYTDGTIPSVLTGQTVDIHIAVPTTRTKSNTLLHCDIIGNPTNYPTAWKQSGVFGTPLIVAEDGTSLLPDGAKDTFKLSRKANATPLLCLRSIDNGVTWTSFTPTFSTTNNAITLTDEPAANLVMVYYQTHTSMATPTVNSEVLEIGGVKVFDSNARASLANSLTGKTTVGSGYAEEVYLKLNSYSISASANKLSGLVQKPEHNYIDIPNMNSTVAVKVFPYLTRLNGKAYLNLVFKEMKYGSYLAPTTVTEASTTYTQNLTYKINIAGCALDGKVIKWIGTTTTSAIDWSLYDVSPTGVIYLLSSGVVYANAKLYDGDSWGDSNKFEIVDNVSTTTDDNGQTVLVGQKTVELSYFIAGDE